MAALGRTIKLHLINGTSSGIIKAEVGNWDGKITASRWTTISELAKDDDIKRPGVYILTGPDKEGTSSESIYIGESENVWERLKHHELDAEKDHFERVLIINRKDDSLNKGHIRYLEYRLLQKAIETSKATIKNSNKLSDSPPLSAPDRDDMESFLETIQIVLPVLGITAMLPSPVKIQSEQTFKLITRSQDTKVQVEAQAQVINGEFVVLQGSTAFQRNDGNIYMKNQKDDLIRNGVLIPDGQVFRFTKNVAFGSPSTAAGVIRGNSTNGRLYWKLDDGRTYDEWEQARIAASESL